MLEQIIKNAVRTVLEHEPDEKELKVFMDYVEGTFSDMERAGKRMTPTDIEIAIYDCRKDCFVQCEECGEYFLPEQEYWNEYAHCCRECKPYSDPDMMPGGHDYY